MRRIGFVLGCLLLCATPALAEPYLAVREGLRCSACHTNMTGGGKRTDLVATHARDLLHYPNFFGAFSNPPEFFSGEINKYFAMGGDLRASETATFQDLPSSNGTVENNKAFRGRLDTNSIATTEAVLYGEFRLIPDMLTFYVDQRLQPSTDNREVFGLLKVPWNGLYFKAGRMFLPYGLELQDDGAFIRGGTNGSLNTGFSFNQQQAGFEIGLEPDPFSFVFAVSDGPSGDRDAQVTGTASVLLTDLPVVRNVMVGTSFSQVGPPGIQTTLFGFFAGSNFERLSVLGEADFRNDLCHQASSTSTSSCSASVNGRNVGRFIAYGEADYLFFGWLNFKSAIDYADNDGTLGNTNDDENRVSFGFEPFLNRFLQPRLFYRVSNGVQSNPSHNQNVLLAEIHAFF